MCMCAAVREVGLDCLNNRVMEDERVGGEGSVGGLPNGFQSSRGGASLAFPPQIFDVVKLEPAVTNCRAMQTVHEGFSLGASVR